jgi:hypothetical protein
MADAIRLMDGEPFISARMFALLFDLELPALQAEIDRQERVYPGAPFRIPEAWLKRGRRITKETQAATGKTDMLSIFNHLDATHPTR